MLIHGYQSYRLTQKVVGSEFEVDGGAGERFGEGTDQLLEVGRLVMIFKILLVAAIHQPKYYYRSIHPFNHKKYNLLHKVQVQSKNQGTLTC